MQYSVTLCMFFFKQKTAYELRISDWSSDVCSSDLVIVEDRRIGAVQFPRAEKGRPVDTFAKIFERPVVEAVQPGLQRRRGLVPEIGVVIIGARFFQVMQYALPLGPKETTSDLQSLMRTPYPVFALKKQKQFNI